MNAKLLIVQEELEAGTLQMDEAQSTIPNCYNVILKNEDYTIGKVIEYILYTLHYDGDKTLSYCGFNKHHPHDTQSTIRVAFKDVIFGDIKVVLQEYIRNAINKSVEIYTNISNNF